MTENSANRFIVVERHTGESVWFDPSNTTLWGPVDADDWPNDEYQAFESLYHHESGGWTLISRVTYLEYDVTQTTAETIDDSLAARWLLRHEFEVPVNVPIPREFLFPESVQKNQDTPQDEPTFQGPNSDEGRGGDNEAGKEGLGEGASQDKTAWPPNQGWGFQPGKAAYNGTEISITGKPWQLLKALVEATRPLTRDQLRAVAWDVNEISAVEDHTVDQHLSTIRRVLRRKLQLPGSFHPIRRCDRGTFVAWELHRDLRQGSVKRN